MGKKVTLSAVQCTSRLTLGNYLGAIKNWLPLQRDYDCIFFAVDMHSITVRVDPKEFADLTYRTIANYIACGIDPDQALLFIQSHVPEHAELGWILTCHTYMGELSRMTQFKDKSGKLEEKSIGAGLFTYPSLMAADILLYQTNFVPVGDDQKQHVEITRDIALRMAHLYGDDLFTLPEIMTPPVGARIMSLQNPTAKMSKSDSDPHATLFLSDSNDVILKKVKRAVTDSGSEITFDDQKPGVKNLLSIQSALTGRPIADLVSGYVGKQYGHLKVETAEIVADAIRPIREKTDHLLEDRAYLDGILRRGAERARVRARATLEKVYDRIGFIPRG